jgi:hypothetical protein
MDDPKNGMDVKETRARLGRTPAQPLGPAGRLDPLVDVATALSLDAAAVLLRRDAALD